MKYQSLLFLGLLLSGSAAFAQSASQCSRALSNAEEAFEQGRLLFVIDKKQNATFFACLEAGSFSIDEEIRAHKLLTKAYLFTDNEEQAEKKLVDLLQSDKEHQLAPEDPAELYFLYSQFKTEPIFRVGFRAGVNKSTPVITQSFNTIGEKKYNGEAESTGIGINFWGEVTAEKYIGNGLEVVGGLQLRGLTYELEEFDPPTEAIFYNIKNTSLMLRTPIMLRYNFGYDQLDSEGNRRVFNPYVLLGASFDYTINAKYTEGSSNLGDGFNLSPDSPESDMKTFDQVTTSNASIMIGVGTKLRFGRTKVNYLNVELRYDNSLFNYIKTENRFANQTLSIDNNFVEDDLYQNAVSLSVGYILSVYKPRKRKQYQ